jgi:hypothetical protein
MSTCTWALRTTLATTVCSALTRPTCPFLIQFLIHTGNDATCVVSLEQRADSNISATIMDAHYNGYQIHTNSAGDYVSIAHWLSASAASPGCALQIITHEIDAVVSEGLSNGIMIDEGGMGQGHASCKRASCVCSLLSFSLNATPHDTARRRAAPLSPAHIYCDVYLDVAQSFYRTWGDGSTVVWRA